MIRPTLDRDLGELPAERDPGPAPQARHLHRPEARAQAIAERRARSRRRRWSLKPPRHTRSRQSSRLSEAISPGKRGVRLAVDVDASVGERADEILEQRDRLAPGDPRLPTPRATAARRCVPAGRTCATGRRRGRRRARRRWWRGRRSRGTCTRGRPRAGTPASCSRGCRSPRRDGRTRSGRPTPGTDATPAASPWTVQIDRPAAVQYSSFRIRL